MPLVASPPRLRQPSARRRRSCAAQARGVAVALGLLAGAAFLPGPLARCQLSTAFAAASWRLAGARLADAHQRTAASRRLPRRAEEDDEDDDDDRGRIRVEDLKPGQELNGLVTSLASFGCFVDIGASTDGFVHISRISTSFVDDVSNFVQPGQSVKVYWMGLDEEGKLGLSMVKDKANPDSGKADVAPFVDVPPDQWLEGNVASITDFGVFVLVQQPTGDGAGTLGLVHISQIRDGFVEHPADEVEVGQSVMVRVVEAIPETGKLKLSMKPYAGPKDYTRASDQDISGFMDVDPSTWLEARVHHTAPFGVFAEIEPPTGGEKVMGLVHVTEIREGFVTDPSEEVEVDQVIKVRVARVDPSTGRLSLSMKSA